jgi:hypothetical protein
MERKDDTGWNQADKSAENALGLHWDERLEGPKKLSRRSSVLVPANG